jgi:hypothetical protein
MSAVARWRQATGRMPFVPGRLPAAVPAVLGSVLAAAAIIWPVLQISQSIGPPGPSSEFVQLLWSWGRYEVTGDEAGTQSDAVNLMPAYVLAGACVAGLLGGLAWLLRSGPDGRVLGSAGVAFALAVVGGSTLQRLGDTALYESVEATGFEVMTLPAGRAALAASALLLVALLLMLWRPVAALARSSWVAGAGMAARGRGRAMADDGAEQAGAGPSPRVGTARLRDASPPGGRPTAGNERNGDGVGFSDGTNDHDRQRRA